MDKDKRYFLLKLYLKISKNSFDCQTTYRVNTYSKILYSVLIFSIQAYIWKAISVLSDNVSESSINNLILYSFVSCCISVFISFETNYTPRIGVKILSGDIATDFIKPINIRNYFFFDYLGLCLYKFIFNFIPVFIVCKIIFKISIKIDFMTIIIFSLSVLLACILYFLICYTVGLLSFWYTSIGQLHIIIDSSITLLSGSFIPLWFLPKAMLKLVDLLPFKYLFYSPISIFMGNTTIIESTIIIGMQLIWISIFVIISKFIYRCGIKKLQILGG